jgi:hypothetical protein
MRKHGVRGFALGEPELNYDNKDADFFLVHIFSNQGYPRARAQWVELLGRTDNVCRRVLYEPGAWRANYFDLRPR